MIQIRDAHLATSLDPASDSLGQRCIEMEQGQPIHNPDGSAALEDEHFGGERHLQRLE
jgi:hypothetical protein